MTSAIVKSSGRVVPIYVTDDDCFFVLWPEEGQHAGFWRYVGLLPIAGPFERSDPRFELRLPEEPSH